MSSSTLEQCRQAHEDIELLAREAVKVLDEEPKSTKRRMLQQHKTSFIIQSTVDRSQTALDLYADKDGLMKEEVAGMKGVNVFKGFYEQLRDIKEYHRRFPDVDVGNVPINEELATHSREVEQFFSGEEMYGKYLDLHTFYVRACNMPQFRIREEYRSFIDKVDKFSGVAQAKKDTQYMGYLQDLLLYLVNFYIRSQPLVVVQEVLDDCIKDFELKWVAGTFEGWKLEANLRGGEAGESSLLIDDADLDLEKYTSAVDLEGLGLDALKKALQKKGMKCGGNLQQRAQRLWQSKGKTLDEIPSKDKVKVAKGKSAGKPAADSSNGSSSEAALPAPYIQNGVPTHVNTNAGSGIVMLGYSLGEPIGHISSMSKVVRFKRTAAMEACIQKMCELLYDVLENTKRQVEKKLTLTHDELEQEMLDEDEGVADIDMEDDDDEDEIPIYNPLNLPVGWDGKPIPFWLYKLHGLGVEYKCEICGNYSYWGRRAFDRHFQEWRHAHGMRCLKIPNTKHFHDITLIEDAINLYEKIKDKADGEVWTTKIDEEFEDSEGNVLNRRTYEDLQKQGIL